MGFYVRLVIEEMLPEVVRAVGEECPQDAGMAARRAAPRGLAEFCDVFCEPRVAFSVAQARAILVAACGLGLGLRIHADQFTPDGGAELAAETITAATVNAAYSLRRGDSLGTLEPGKLADFAVHDCEDYRELAYFFGRETAREVCIEGRRVYP